MEYLVKQKEILEDRLRNIVIDKLDAKNKA